MRLNEERTKEEEVRAVRPVDKFTTNLTDCFNFAKNCYIILWSLNIKYKLAFGTLL